MRGTGPGRLGEARRGPEPGRDPSLGPDSISAVTFSSQVRRSPGGQLLSASAWVTPSPLWDSRPSLHQGGSPTPMLLLCDPLCGGGERRGGGWAGSILCHNYPYRTSGPTAQFQRNLFLPTTPPPPDPGPGNCRRNCGTGWESRQIAGWAPKILPPTHAVQPVVSSVTPGWGPLSLAPHSSHTDAERRQNSPGAAKATRDPNGPIGSLSAWVLVSSRGGLEMRAEGTREPGRHSRPRPRKGHFSLSPTSASLKSPELTLQSHGCLGASPRSSPHTRPSSLPSAWDEPGAGAGRKYWRGRLSGPGPGLLGSVPSSSRTPSPSGVTPSPLPSSRLHSGLWNDSGQGAPLAHPPGQAYVPEFIGAPPGGDRRTYTWFLRARSHLRPLRVCARARGCGAWCPRAPGTACSPSVCPGGRLTPEPNRLEWLVMKFLFVSMGPRVESGRDENGWVGCGRVRGIGPGWGSSRDRAPGE